MAAAPGDVLDRCLREAGYTPPRRELPDLLQRLIESSEEHASALERAIARAGSIALEPALALLERLPDAQRPRILELLARLASELDTDAARTRLCGALLVNLDSTERNARKWAARALGKLGDARAEAPLLGALAAAPPAEQKSLVDALAVLGTQASLEPLRALTAHDVELGRRRERALAAIERRLLRSAGGSILLDRALGTARRVRLHCRAGLAELLCEELRALGHTSARLLGAAATATGVELSHAGTLRELLASRIALEVALPVAPAAEPGEPSERWAQGLSQLPLLEALQRWTDGVPRFRVDWSDAGHRRAQVWALTQALRRRTGALVNDSERALWTLRARADAGAEGALVPRIDPDPRFSYRVRDVPAASHPTIAAALARSAGVQPDEVVWDPFVGSGLELIERARLGPVRRLYGTDVDAGALAAARANLDAAGVSAELVQRSALEFAPSGVSLILSNPPMGRRVARDGSLAGLLSAFVAHAASVLRPAGRVVWLSPLAALTERAAREAGLSVWNGPEVDLGGFGARLQLLRRAGA